MEEDRKKKKPKVKRCSFCKRTAKQSCHKLIEGQGGGKICFDCIKEKKKELDEEEKK